MIGLFVYYKLSKLRDKYPEDQKLLEELALVAFRNNAKIPKKDFNISGWGYNREDLEKILKEFDIKPSDFEVQHFASNTYTRNHTTCITFRKN